jgi:DNA-binding transcriptional regulator of glucitol operon
MFWLLVCTFVVVYLIQMVLGLRQAKHFAENFSELRRRGRVAIGKRKGLFTAGALVMFLLNEDGIIVEGRRMTGVTVMARFRPLVGFNGEDLASITLAGDRRYSAGVRSAVENARENYLIITSGGVAAEPPTAIARMTTRLRSVFKRRSPLSA